MRKINEPQKKYVQARAKGLTKKQSALMAGYTPDSDDGVGVEDSPTVQAALAEIRAETAANVKITKEDVVQMLMDAVDMAKLLGDPTAVVSAARELGKMLGFYAPEVKKITHGLDRKSIIAIMDAMNDEELMRLSNARTIEAEPAKLIPENV